MLVPCCSSFALNYFWYDLLQVANILLALPTVTVSHKAWIPAINSSFDVGLTSLLMYSLSSCHKFRMDSSPETQEGWATS